MTEYIACFDSGMGGITTLAAMRALLPQENFIYYADTLHTPYGGRPFGEVRQLTRTAVGKLLPYGLKALVLACNTATSAAAQTLRQELSLPVLGLEPAIKPALQQTPAQVIVMGTELTVRERKFHNLLRELDARQRVIPLSCPGLVELIEQSPVQPQVQEYLRQLLAPYAAQSGAIVLGCTHYVFLRPLLRQMWPALPLFDGNAGVARRLQNLLGTSSTNHSSGELLWMSSAPNTAAMRADQAKFQEYYHYCRQNLHQEEC